MCFFKERVLCVFVTFYNNYPEIKKKNLKVDNYYLRSVLDGRSATPPFRVPENGTIECKT